MVNKKGRIIPIIILLSLIFGTSAFSEGTLCGSEINGNMFKKSLKGIDLTEVQKEQLNENFNETKKMGKVICEEMKAVEGLLQDELGKTDPSINSIDAIVVRMKQISAKAIDHRVNNMIQMRKILTEDQYHQFLKRMGKNRSIKNDRMRQRKRHKGSK